MRRALLFLCLLSAPAVAAEIREVRLQDGRVFVAEVLRSDESGMILRVPQGALRVGYDQLAGLSEVDEGDPRRHAVARFAIAPTQAFDRSLENLAREVDGVLGRAARAVPSTDPVPPAAWAVALGRSFGQLVACGGDPDCLLDTTSRQTFTWVLAPRIVDAGGLVLVLDGWAAATGDGIGSARIPVPQREGGGLDAPSLGRALGPAIFEAFGLRPEVDVAARMGEIFPGLSATAPATAPVDEPVAEAEPEERPLVLPHRRWFRPKADGPTLREALAWGAVPIPGLGPAYLSDPVGVVASSAGTLAVSWVSVYGVGRSARTAPAFWAGAIGLPLLTSIAFDELSVLIGWRRQGDVAVLPMPLDGGAGISIAIAR